MTDEQLSSPLAQANTFFDSVPEPNGTIEDILDDALYDGARRLDQSLTRTCELRLRLAGPDVVDGFYDPDVEAALAGNLGAELSAAADMEMPGTRLGLVGISPGSVVLHYRPMASTTLEPDQLSDLQVSPADVAVRRVLSLHNQFESQASGAEIASSVKGNRKLLRGARGVVQALLKYHLDLSATWWSPSGERVRSILTEKGQVHSESIFLRQEQEYEIQVWGHVSALDVDGIVTVRRESHRFKIQASRDDVLRFSLGESIILLVLQRAHVDRVGLSGQSEYIFLRRLDQSPELDMGDL